MQQHILLWQASPCPDNVHMWLKEQNSQSLEMYKMETLIALKNVLMANCTCIISLINV